MEIIKKLQDYKTNQNIDYIEELVDIILEEKIENLNELKNYEIKYNNISNNNYNEVIFKYLKEIDSNPYEYEGLLYDNIQLLKQIRKQIDTNVIEDKILNFIKYFKITNRDNLFPYVTYQLIINDKL